VIGLTGHPVDGKRSTQIQEDRLCAAPRISVVVSARNEAKNLPHVPVVLPGGIHEVMAVDGSSVDGTTVAQAVRPAAKIIRENRRGKGNAPACGFAYVTGELVVTLHANGSAGPGIRAESYNAVASLSRTHSSLLLSEFVDDRH
jgi:glycosyltransferase involved in cell wall biosynthesis